LLASETIFIDDTIMHYKAAETIGIKSIWAKKPIGNWFLDEVKKLEI
jgi:FMN phosphatase YigB (HAD superfamily)